MHITFLRKANLIGKYRLQHGKFRSLFFSQSLSRIRLGKTGHCTDCSCWRLIYQFIFFPGIYPDLIHFFFPAFPLFHHFQLGFCLIGKHCFYLQTPPRYFHISKSRILIISSNLINFCSKTFGIDRINHIFSDSLNKFFHPCHFQSRTKKTRKYLSFLNQSGNLPLIHISFLQILFQKFFFCHGNLLLPLFFPW